MHPTYTRTTPFLAPIRERHSLTKPASGKMTTHLVLDLARSGIHYKTGDSLGVFPLNDPIIVGRILELVGASGEEEVMTKTGETLAFRHFLSSRANLDQCNRSFFSAIGACQTGENQKKIAELLAADKEHLKSYLTAYHVWDLLEEFPVKMAPQDLASLLMPLLPRFYSIASSMLAVGEEAHLTVGLTRYALNGRPRYGVASHYLTQLAPLHEPIVPVYLQPSKDFTLPEDKTAGMIMVGAGTGVAPYRGFMQERVLTGATGKNWLFFGERSRQTDYLYEEYWTELEARGKLRLDLAFSRDQEEKIYVQHRLLESGRDVYRWLEEGAYFYVCGDALSMAKAVEGALHTIICEQGGKSADAATERIKALRKEKRYLRDVY